MTVKQLIKELEKLNPETEIQIADDNGCYHKAIWIMHYKGKLTIGWEN